MDFHLVYNKWVNELTARYPLESFYYRDTNVGINALRNVGPNGCVLIGQFNSKKNLGRIYDNRKTVREQKF